MPLGNPYIDHPVAEYFHDKDQLEKVRIGGMLARHAEQLLGRKGRMLELGSGRGELLRGAADQGWMVRGVEMTPEFADNGMGVDVEIAAVESASSLRERWDCILLAAILEHLYEPREALRRVADALEPGGVVFIDVPNECSIWSRAGNGYYRARGRDWAVNLSPTFPPYHVVGFCPRSLRYLLDIAGLEVVSLDTHRWRNELPRTGSLANRIELLGADLALTVGQWMSMGAGILCWAKKAPNEKLRA